MKKIVRYIAAMAAAFTLFFTAAIPTRAIEYPVGGPWGDIDGWYSWYITPSGTTIFCQNNQQWRYDGYGNRIYVDNYGNDISNPTPSSARSTTIATMGLTYYGTTGTDDLYASPDGNLYTVDDNGHMHYYGKANTLQPSKPNMPEPVNKAYTMKYSVTTWEGTHIYIDEYNNAWWFSAGGYPNPYYGDWKGTSWKEGIPDYTYTYAGISSDNYYLWKDVYGHYWWFEAGGQPHQYTGKVTPTSSGNTGTGTTVTPTNNKPAETNVDWYVNNTMEADGRKSVVYKGQYWQAPTSVSWAPEGMHLIGWDYAENTGYVRWKPGAWILNTGHDVYLYPVYSY